MLLKTKTRVTRIFVICEHFGTIYGIFDVPGEARWTPVWEPVLLRFPRALSWGSKADAPNRTALIQRSFGLDKCGSLTFHNPYVQVGRLLSYERSNQSRHPADFELTM
jgi:hypothetical protein